MDGQIGLHFLPTYAPETNPRERVWWQPHEELTRNHRCQTLQELVEQVMGCFASRRGFRPQTEYFRQFYLQAALRYTPGVELFSSLTTGGIGVTTSGVHTPARR